MKRLPGTDIGVLSQTPGRYTQFGYKAATYGRENAAEAVGGTADYHMRYDRSTIVNLARAMERDNWLIEGLINRCVDYILGPAGFTLQAKTADPDLNKRIEQEIWPAFSAAPEVRGLFDWADYQRLNLREAFVAGDQLNLKIGGDNASAGMFQHIEGERMDSFGATGDAGGDVGNRVEQGVVLDKRGRPVAYKVSDVSPTGYVTHSARTVPAEHAIFFGSVFKRSSQTRCLPVFVSSLPIAHRLDDILTAAAVAWQIQARLVVGIFREKNKTRPAIRSGVNAGTKADRGDNEISSLITDAGMSLIFQGVPGDKIEPIATNRPGAQLDKDVETFVRLFCVPVGLPAEVLLLFWRDFNYSSARIVLLQAFLNFRRWQRHLAVGFNSHAYRWQIGRAIALGTIPWRDDIFAHEWNLPAWPWIDEDREVSAWSKKLDRAIATQTEVLASLGKDRVEQQATRHQEIMDAWAAAQQIEEDSGGGIKAADLWRHLAGLEQGKTELAVRAGDKSKIPPSGESDAIDNVAP